jgi:hypothetical protein
MYIESIDGGKIMVYEMEIEKFNAAELNFTAE